MDGQKDGWTEGRKAEKYVPPLFFEKAGDNNKNYGKDIYFYKLQDTT